MLMRLSPLLTPDLLHALASMGHGDEVVLADANFPSATLGNSLIHLPGASAPAALRGVGSYQRAGHAVAIVAIGDVRAAGHIIRKKGVTPAGVPLREVQTPT